MQELGLLGLGQNQQIVDEPGDPGDLGSDQALDTTDLTT